MSGFETARDRAEALREGIEELLLEESARAATAHLKDAEAAVSRYCEVGSTEAGLAALDALRASLEKAKGALASSSDASLVDEAITWAGELRARALDELSRLSPDAVIERREPALGFRASRGAPTVHEARDVPALEVFAKKRPWDAIESDDDEEPMVPVGKDIDAGLARLGRDAMEDIAILGGLRRCEEEEKWSDAIGFEDRLLANLDLLWALDSPAHDDVPRLGVPRALFRYATEWALPDWGRAFAVSFGLGCSSSEAALRWVMLAMRRSAASVYGAYVHGLSVASNPYVDRTIASELRTDASPELLAALLEIAERRHTYEASAIVPLLAHPVAEVRIAALRAMRAAPKDVAIASARSLLGSGDASVSIRAADELARMDQAEGLEHMREVLGSSTSSPDRGLALRAIALAGVAKDEALLVEHTRDREDGVVWLSFYGKPSVVPLIAEELGRLRDQGGLMAARIARAERAYNRVTGLDPSGDGNALVLRFEESGQAKKAARLRAGEALSARTIVTELESPVSRQGERRILARELPLHVPDAPYLDVDAFHATQLAILTSIELR